MQRAVISLHCKKGGEGVGVLFFEMNQNVGQKPLETKLAPSAALGYDSAPNSLATLNQRLNNLEMIKFLMAMNFYKLHDSLNFIKSKLLIKISVY